MISMSCSNAPAVGSLKCAVNWSDVKLSVLLLTTDTLNPLTVGPAVVTVILTVAGFAA